MRLRVSTTVILLFLAFSHTYCIAQESSPWIVVDTIKVKEIKPKSNRYFDPDRAALLSAVFPGLGQIYNRKYWKVPLVLGGIGTFYYFIKRNERLYISYRNAGINVANPGANLWVDPDVQDRVERIDQTRVASALERAETLSRRNRDFTIILAAAAYGIVIVDAYIDAHLKAFKISKDLSFKTKPSAESTLFAGPAYGIALNISLK